MGSGASRLMGAGGASSGGGNNPNRMPGATTSTSGNDTIVGPSLTSLLGLPPPQPTAFPQVYQENGIPLRSRNHQWPNVSASVMELYRRRSDVQQQIQAVRANQNSGAQPNSRALLMELTTQLGQIESQINAREMMGPFVSSPIPPPQGQPGSSNFWSAMQDDSGSAGRFNVNHRLPDLRFSGGSCGRLNSGSSANNNPPSPRSLLRGGNTNGFRSPRHNSGTENFPVSSNSNNNNNSSTNSGFLILRGVPSSMSRGVLESALGDGLVKLNSLPTRGTFLARFSTQDAALSMALHFSSLPNSPIFANIIEERQAFELLMEAYNVMPGVAAATSVGSGTGAPN